MNTRLITLLAALAIAALGLVACGSDDSGDDTTAAATTSEETTAEETTGGSGGSGGSVAIEADPGGGLAYTTGDVSTDAGTVTIDFENTSSTPHDVRVEDSSGNDVGGTEVITGSSESVDLELEPGTYTYYCSVSGHRAAGMEGTLTVE